MSNYSEEVGSRLKQIRFIFNEGGKLSADQFAYLLGETRDRIANYELGRAGIPVRVIYELYRRGINPVYIIAGEGSVFADNAAGKSFGNRIKEKINSGWVFSDESISIFNFTDDDLSIDNSFVIKLAAGKIEGKG